MRSARKQVTVVEWCDGPRKISNAGRPTIWMIVGQGLAWLAVGAGGGCLDIFTLLYLVSSFSLPLETARYSWLVG